MTDLHLYIGIDGTDYFVQGELMVGTLKVTWFKDYGTTKPNCKSFSSESIAFYWAHGDRECDFTSSALLLSAA